MEIRVTNGINDLLVPGDLIIIIILVPNLSLSLNARLSRLVERIQALDYNFIDINFYHAVSSQNGRENEMGKREWHLEKMS